MPANRRVLGKIREKWGKIPAIHEVGSFQPEINFAVQQAVHSFHAAKPGEKILFIGSSGVPVNIPQASIDIAMPHIKTGTHVVGTGEKLPFKSESFGFGVSVFTFDYLKKKRATKELWRVLKPGAKALVILHHPESILTRSSKGFFLHAKSLRKYFNEVKKTWSLDARDNLFKTLSMFNNYPGITLMDLKRAADILHKGSGTPGQVQALDRTVSRIQKEVAQNPTGNLFRLGKNMFKYGESAQRFFNENGFHAEVNPVYDGPGREQLSWLVVLSKQSKKR